MAGSSTALKIVFPVLGCFMLSTLIYTTVTNGSPFRADVLTPWMIATLIDFYVNVVAISVWVVYKEPNWIKAALWVLALVCFGRFGISSIGSVVDSMATCAYITVKLFNISSQDPQDPVSQLLLRKDHERQAKCSSVMLGRISFSILGIFMSTVVVYTVVTDGPPFRMELLTPWMAATLIDFYINVFAISVWVVHKESTWLGAFVWICLLICLGSIATCAYIVIQFFRLSSHDPVYNILLDSEGKNKTTSSK